MIATFGFRHMRGKFPPADNGKSFSAKQSQIILCRFTQIVLELYFQSDNYFLIGYRIALLKLFKTSYLILSAFDCRSEQKRNGSARKKTSNFTTQNPTPD